MLLYSTVNVYVSLNVYVIHVFQLFHCTTFIYKTDLNEKMPYVKKIHGTLNFLFYTFLCNRPKKFQTFFPRSSSKQKKEGGGGGRDLKKQDMSYRKDRNELKYFEAFFRLSDSGINKGGRYLTSSANAIEEEQKKWNCLFANRRQQKRQRRRQ